MEWSKLPIDDDQLHQISASIQNYKRVGIEIKLVEIDTNFATVVIKQSELHNGIILSNKELYDRCKAVVVGIDFDIKIKPAVFSFQSDTVTANWILEKTKEFGLSRNDLEKQLAIPKSYLSQIFSEGNSAQQIKIPNQTKALFFYYFLNFANTKQLRAEISEKQKQ